MPCQANDALKVRINKLIVRCPAVRRKPMPHGAFYKYMVLQNG